MKLISQCQKILFFMLLILLVAGCFKTAAYIMPMLVLLAATFAFFSI